MTQRKPTAALEDTPVFHPLLLAICPILGLYAYNVGTVSWTVLIRPILVALAVAEVLLIGFWIGLRDKHKAGLLTSVLLLALVWGWGVLETSINAAFPYVQVQEPIIVYTAMAGLVVILTLGIVVFYRANLRRALMMASLFLAFVLGGALVVGLFLDRVFGVIASTFILTYIAVVTVGLVCLARWKQDFKPWTRTANWFGVMLVALYSALVLFNAPREEKVIPPPLEVTAENAPGQEAFPDIYLFVVEGYARCDVLLKRYSYNDLPVLESLQQKGMKFSPDAFSNYSWDMQSVASLLNMDYLDRLLPPKMPDTTEYASLTDLYHHNRFFRILRGHGYEIVAYSPGVQALEAGPLIDRKLSPPWTLTEFEAVLLNTAVTKRCLEIVFYAKGLDPRAWFRGFHRARIEYVFETIDEVAAEEHQAPRLVFAHLTIPDMPFLFGRKGGWVDLGSAKTFEEFYLDQLHYTGKRLRTAVEEICQGATRPFVIVIASSHGPAMLSTDDMTEPGALAARFGILLGLRYPETDKHGPAPAETKKSLVNTLRTVLNRSVHANVPLLEDQAYLTSQERPLEGQPVTIPILETAVTPVLEAR
ncbi:MAG: hypothetical protein R6V12_04040 [Candidatus Hydrogenedentota bacterium]